MSIFRTAVLGVLLAAPMMAALSINLTVVEILDAAHESARTGKRIDFR